MSGVYDLREDGHSSGWVESMRARRIGPDECDADALGRLIRSGRPAEAVVLAGVAITRARGPAEIARVLLMKLGALLNLGRTSECPAVVDEAYAALTRCDEPALLGEFHALAANVAYHQGSLDRCVTHLVSGGRALERVRKADHIAAMAWLDLAVTYSNIGFHGHAMTAHQRSQAIAAAADLDPVDFAHPEIRIRYAISLDHQGDSEMCARLLAEALDELGPDDVAPFELPYLGYAQARLATLRPPPDGGPGPLMWADVDPTGEANELRQLADACLAIAGGQPNLALTRLALAEACVTVFGAAEVPRLRAIAHVALGDHESAHRAERDVARQVSQSVNRLHDLFVEGISARLDHDELRRRATQYADEAHTDPLTGLPNRRHLERYVDELTAMGRVGSIGVADLDGFKIVNTVHGHLSGDRVLQRVAAILTRTLRRGDFLARFGGDEFVIVLPGTDPAEAQEVSERLAAAIAADDWEAIVPGTPVTLTVGWAELNARTGILAAFQAADMGMLRAKAQWRAAGGKGAAAR
ncbi:GGDEF domain-containing protein [Allorhizocola rhizosphaerae]|uniref:GGDEF domain-containing protein n=1 Tax=Allorhizocola rhizosphaerae TaxID=1872709 RepID=UPI000E3E11C8|nr:GGDEF domain-containing protein [Allorhizocola rhizosphaerae]